MLLSAFGIDAIRRSTANVITMIALGMLLVGCASGQAEDARRGQRAAASETPVLPGRQATFSAQRYGEATPDATPESRSNLQLYEIGLATQVESDGEPNGLIGSVPANFGRVYIAADIDGLDQGDLVAAVWVINAEIPEDRDVVGYQEATVDASGRQWITFGMDFTGQIPPGDYAVIIYVGDEVPGTLGFEVTSGGQPRRLG